MDTIYNGTKKVAGEWRLVSRQYDSSAPEWDECQGYARRWTVEKTEYIFVPAHPQPYFHRQGPPAKCW